MEEGVMWRDEGGMVTIAVHEGSGEGGKTDDGETGQTKE